MSGLQKFMSWWLPYRNDEDFTGNTLRDIAADAYMAGYSAAVDNVKEKLGQDNE